MNAEGGHMSEETAREIAEREIGRSDEKRKTPERRTYRSGSGRRGDNSSKKRAPGANGSKNPQKQRTS
jgi:hypothetical protein